MKKLTTSLVCSLGLLLAAHAGESNVTVSKNTVAPVSSSCFSDHEFQLDTFGQVSYGSQDKIGVFRGTGVGGGVGLNYFFHRNIGLGIEGAWLDAEHNSGNPDWRRSEHRHDHTVIHNATGSLIFRLPIPSTCVAPYAYLGGGYQADGHAWASAHAGLGLEYRLVPNKLGLFVDERFTYLGDRFGRDDLNFWSTRFGVRVVF